MEREMSVFITFYGDDLEKLEKVLGDRCTNEEELYNGIWELLDKALELKEAK